MLCGMRAASDDPLTVAPEAVPPIYAVHHYRSAGLIAAVSE